MKTEQELYESLKEKWFEAEKEIWEKHSKVAENNKRVHEKPLNGRLNLNETQRALWESINLLDQVSLESVKEKFLQFRCLLTLLTAWHENYDQPGMINANNRFF